MNHDVELARLVDAALPHVAFDGWSETALQAAIDESGIAPGLARALVPRGAVDLALAWHRMGDARMTAALAAMDLSGLRFREKVALAVRLRLQDADREVVRRGTALFALPSHAAEGVRAIWSTADAIWTALGDTSRDVNWYSKRTILSAVYGSTVLYWLGDDSPAQADTWAFLERRIENVMQFEKVKAGIRANSLGRALLAGPLKVLERISAPKPQDNLPGHMKGL